MSESQPEMLGLNESSRRQLAVVNQFSHQVIGSMSIHDVIQSGLEGIVEVVQADLAVLFLVKGNELCLEGMLAGNPVCRLTNITMHCLGECLCGLAASLGDAVYSSDITHDSRCTKDECKQAGLKAFAALPLSYSGQVLGVLGLANCDNEGGDFKSQADFLEILANHMAIGIKNAMFIDELNLTIKELKSARKKWEGIFQSIGDPVTILDGEQRIVNANQATLSLLRMDLDRVRGRFCYELFHGRADSPAECPFQQMLKSGKPQGRIMAVEVCGRELLVSVSPIFDEAGVLTGAIHYGRDVTDLHRFERERETMIRELELKNSKLEQFVYTVSHDLKTPLVGINGFIGLLQKDMEEGNAADVEHDMDYIRRSAQHMYDLLNDLLNYSRLGYVENASESFDSHLLIAEVLDILQTGPHSGTVEMVAPEAMPRLHGDRLRLAQVFQNLIANAIKFSRGQARPRVEIGCCRQEGVPVFYVRDNGIGIDAPYYEKIFDLFHQLDPQTGGTGVGLTITRRIVELNGGRIWVESAGKGLGSTFYFTLGKQCYC